jgi:hypothetical protein
MFVLGHFGEVQFNGVFKIFLTKFPQQISLSIFIKSHFIVR